MQKNASFNFLRTAGNTFRLGQKQANTPKHIHTNTAQYQPTIGVSKNDKSIKRRNESCRVRGRERENHRKKFVDYETGGKFSMVKSVDLLDQVEQMIEESIE